MARKLGIERIGPVRHQIFRSGYVRHKCYVGAVSRFGALPPREFGVKHQWPAIFYLASLEAVSSPFILCHILLIKTLNSGHPILPITDCSQCHWISSYLITGSFIPKLSFSRWWNNFLPCSHVRLALMLMASFRLLPTE